jgi:hypothetical protein
MLTKKIGACLLSVAILAFPKFGCAEEWKNENAIVIVTDYSYKIGHGDSREKLKALALFGAKYKAVILSAKYLTHKGLLPDYGKKEKEICCLAADEISADIVEHKKIKRPNLYTVKIEAKIKTVDFLKAEIKNLELEKEEMNFSYQEELGQHIYKAIDPSEELSRAYRYLRKGYWRITVIYLNHLGKKYPNWAELYHVKAIGLYAENKTKAMMEALKTSCSLGSREACEDIEGLIHHAKDLKIY